MSVTIIHKKGSGIPSAESLEVAEIAVDVVTGKLYTKTDDGKVVEISGSSDGSGGGGESLWEQNGDDIYYNDGRVGIGTDSPTNSLTLADNRGAANEYPFMHFNSAAGVTQAGMGWHSTSNAFWIEGVDGNGLDFRTDSKDRIRIHTDGLISTHSEFETRKGIAVKQGADNADLLSFEHDFRTAKHTVALSGVNNEQLRFKRIESDGTEDTYYLGGDPKHVWYVGKTGSMTAGMDLSSSSLQVKGDVVAYSSSVSDARLKDNVETIDNALDKVCALRGVSYTWNQGSREGQQDIGVIAQEVETVFPEIVREHEMTMLDGETYKTVDYEKLCGVLIEAVKELKAEVEELKRG